ncbi:MAG: hypothetical protein IMZ43_09295 [Thermoplasmata archaeon]|nr:hypothetical protein [Thermoplasmata archaeon]
MSKRVKTNRRDGVGRGTSWKMRDGMLWGEEVPHDIRKDFLILFLFRRMGCGKRRGEKVLLDFLFEDCALPQADTWMGKYCSGCVRGVFIFFNPFTTLPCVSAWQYLHPTYNI